LECAGKAQRRLRFRTGQGVGSESGVALRLPPQSTKRVARRRPNRQQVEALAGLASAKSIFTSPARFGYRCRAMTKTLLPLGLAAALTAGCVSTRLTNLTATTQPRNATGLYPIEYEWSSNQQTIRYGSIQPHVVVGFDTYEMKPILRTTNRWEALVPVAANADTIYYRFKVDYEYNRFGKKPGLASKSSPEYKLTIK
jgi:hypothetical protein